MGKLHVILVLTVLAAAQFYRSEIHARTVDDGNIKRSSYKSEFGFYWCS